MSDHLTTVVGVATGGDGGAIDAAENANGRPEEVRRILADYDIPWAQVVREDVARALEGRPPHYFAHASYYARRYIAEHGGGYREPVKTVWSMADMAEMAERALEGELPRRYTLACPAEQAFFYQTPQWQDRAKAARVADGLRCTRCGGGGVLHVHHTDPIWSAWSRKFEKNFRLDRLRTLCEECHEWKHQDMMKTVGGFQYASSPEEMETHREQRRERQRRHDRRRECQFCQQHVWS